MNHAQLISMYVYSRSSITETEEGCFIKKFCLLAKTKFEDRGASCKEGAKLNHYSESLYYVLLHCKETLNHL